MTKKSAWTSPKLFDSENISLEVFNSSDSKVYKRVNLKRFIGLQEHAKILSKKNKIYDANGQIIPYSFDVIEHPKNSAWSEKDLIIHLTLAPKETKKITIDIKGSQNITSAIANQYATTMGQMKDDILNLKSLKRAMTYYNGVFESQFVKLAFDYSGLKSFVYRGQELINKVHNLFVPLRFLDQKPNDYKTQYNSRFNMGRNIIPNTAIREVGKYLNHQIKIDKQNQNAEVIVNYQLGGTNFTRLRYKISNYDPLIEIGLEMLKLPTWSNETVLLSMPYQEYEIEYGKKYQIDKDQIPGSLVNYHSLIEGLIYKKMKINHLDTALIYAGPIIHSQFKLANDPSLKLKSFQEHYAILTTNNWETNFSIDQGGFHEFRFLISPINNYQNVEEELFGQAIEVIIKRIE